MSNMNTIKCFAHLEVLLILFTLLIMNLCRTEIEELLTIEMKYWASLAYHLYTIY